MAAPIASLITRSRFVDRGSRGCCTFGRFGDEELRSAPRNWRFRPSLVWHQQNFVEEAAMPEETTTRKRGFASMTPEQRREIASKGGKSLPAEKRTFSQDRRLASRAGRKGGRRSA